MSAAHRYHPSLSFVDLSEVSPYCVVQFCMPSFLIPFTMPQLWWMATRQALTRAAKRPTQRWPRATTAAVAMAQRSLSVLHWACASRAASRVSRHSWFRGQMAPLWLPRHRIHGKSGVLEVAMRASVRQSIVLTMDQALRGHRIPLTKWRHVSAQ